MVSGIKQVTYFFETWSAVLARQHQSWPSWAGQDMKRSFNWVPRFACTRPLWCLFCYTLQKLGRYFCVMKTLQAFHMKCQRQILHLHRSQHDTTAEVSARSGLPPVRDFVSLWPHSSAHSGDSAQCSALPSRPGIRSFTWFGLETSSWSSSRSPEQTNSSTTLDLSLPASGGRPCYGAMVEWHDSLSWLRDDNDDDESSHKWTSACTCTGTALNERDWCSGCICQVWK